ncbi:MAG: gamma-glutamyltransferase family protein [Arenicella sp.]|jgi:gamma-glutamyltranspeptidase/glutathione hydrolase|nr:gamma-glutamyltransferase family protein [Arenicella sp.]
MIFSIPKSNLASNSSTNIKTEMALITQKCFSYAAVAALLAISGCTHSDSAMTATTLGDQAIVVTANPHATKAGADVLRAGGSAIDAAIAIEAVLSLVEPQSSGLAGGAFMLYFDAAKKNLSAYDGRETAPMGISATQFLQESGESIGFLNAKNSGLSTGVPGVVAMLEMAHSEHGKLAWGSQFDHAIDLAEQGFPVSERLHGMIARFGKYIPKELSDGPIEAAEYFFDSAGEPLAVGAIRNNPEYAKTLRAMARDPRAMYEGEIADKIVARVQQAPRAGALQKTDLENYTPLKLEALCQTYKGYSLCGPPPASSWVAVGQIMGILDHSAGFKDGGADNPDNWTLFSEAQRLAYADRDHFIADAQFVNMPLDGMLDEDYLASRAKLINADTATETLEHGDPWAFQAQERKVAMGVDATMDFAGTTHFVVVDHDGNVVSMTASVESIFGSTRMVGGMFLNNQLTDFSFRPADENGLAIANRIEGGKRPRSSMSPTIVFDQNGEFAMATGSPGGNSIIAYTAKTLVAVLAWGLSPEEAVSLPNMVSRGERVRIEKERASAELIQGLKDFGYNVNESAGENSGLSVVVRSANGALQGAADPRREGTAELVDRNAQTEHETKNVRAHTLLPADN